MLFIWENLLAIISLGLMFYSIYQQIVFIKLKRKSIEVPAKVLKTFPKKIGTGLEVDFDFEEKNYRAQSYSFKKHFHENDEVNIKINPREINILDKSLVISPLLKKMNLYKEPKRVVLLTDHNPNLLNIGIIVFAMMILAFY